MEIFSNPIICLDGDESGQKAAFRIAEKLFPLINEKNRIFFSIMPDGFDPDDYIKQNGKDGLLNLLKEKEIIQSLYGITILVKSIKTILMKFQNLKKKLKNCHIPFKTKRLKSMF